MLGRLFLHACHLSRASSHTHWTTCYSSHRNTFIAGESPKCLMHSIFFCPIPGYCSPDQSYTSLISRNPFQNWKHPPYHCQQHSNWTSGIPTRNQIPQLCPIHQGVFLGTVQLHFSYWFLTAQLHTQITVNDGHLNGRVHCSYHLPSSDTHILSWPAVPRVRLTPLRLTHRCGYCIYRLVRINHVHWWFLFD